MDFLQSLGIPASAAVLCSGGPPCTDHSRTRGAAAPGAKGDEGRKLGDYALWIAQFCTLAPWQVCSLVEHVIPHDVGPTLEQLAPLRQPSFIVDPIDVGPVRRPRLWTTNLPLEAGGDVRWGKYDGLWRLYLPGPKTTIADIDTNGWQFSQAVQQGKATVPTLLTPAPSDAGRPAPKGSLRKCSQQAIERWEADGRQYAPWLY